MSVDSTSTLALVSAIISGIVALVTSRGTTKSKYVMGKRQKWRKDIRSIAKEISETNKDAVGPIIAKLKVRLNPYGKHEDLDRDDYYEHDGHIWALLEEIKSSSDDSFEKKIYLLIEYLSLLLKQDWEKAKLETEKNYSGIGWSLIVAAVVVWNSIPMYGLYRGVNCLYSFGLGIIFSIALVYVPLAPEGKVPCSFNKSSATCVLSLLVSLLAFFCMWSHLSCIPPSSSAYLYRFQDQDKYIRVALYLFLILYITGCMMSYRACCNKKGEMKKYVDAIKAIGSKLKREDQEAPKEGLSTPS